MLSMVPQRNSKKALILFSFIFILLFFTGGIIKNLNDKVSLMTSSVQSYQKMIDTQTEQLGSISLEKERLKRAVKEEQETHQETLKELRDSMNLLKEKCEEKTSRLEKQYSQLQELYKSLQEKDSRLESKFKTLSKSNVVAIGDVERLQGENKKLRMQLQEANSAKDSEMIKMRDHMGQLSIDRDKWKDQYLALFKQQQQSLDSIQLLQNEKDRLQEQIREIQKLSGGGKPTSSPKSTSNKPASGQRQMEPNVVVNKSSSTARPGLVPQVMEEPRSPASSSSTSASPLVGGAVAAQPPPMAEKAKPRQEKQLQYVFPPPHQQIPQAPPQKHHQAPPPLVRQLPQHQVLPQHFQPIQPQYHQGYLNKQKAVLHDDHIDVLQAPGGNYEETGEDQARYQQGGGGGYQQQQRAGGQQYWHQQVPPGVVPRQVYPNFPGRENLKRRAVNVKPWGAGHGQFEQGGVGRLQQGHGQFQQGQFQGWRQNPDQAEDNNEEQEGDQFDDEADGVVQEDNLDETGLAQPDPDYWDKLNQENPVIMDRGSNDLRFNPVHVQEKKHSAFR